MKLRRGSQLLAWAVLALMAVVSACAAETPEGALNREEFALIAQTLGNSAAQGVPAPADDFSADLQSGAWTSANVQQAAMEALIAYAGAMHNGRLNWDRAPNEWAVRPAPFDAVAALAQARTQGSLAAWLPSLAPPHAAYRFLVDARAKYAAIAAMGGWPTIDGSGVLREGDRGARVSALRARLAKEGYVVDNTPDDMEVFDTDLAGQVIRFQTSRRLSADGIVRSDTLEALNAPVEDMLRRIDLALERERWFPRQVPAERVEVNIAAADLTYFNGDAPVLSMRAIVGARRTRTPMFAAEIEAVTLNPQWVAPESIARGEILPRAARDPGYLEAHNYTITDGRVVQAPGPNNALGFVKFELPNPFSVYLHDTPERALFAASQRTRSHGCVRLELPRQLAAALLRDQGETNETIDTAIATGQTQRLNLSRDVPVFFLYRTVHAGADGNVQLEPDVYAWDARLEHLLGDGAIVAQARDQTTECAEN